MVDYTQVIYGGESESDVSSYQNSRHSFLRKKSNGSSRRSSGASGRGSRAKSASPAESPTKSAGKTITTARRSKSHGRVSFADPKPVSPSHNLESPRYSPPPAHRQSINIFTGEPLDLSHTITKLSFNPDGTRRPSTYLFSSSHRSPSTPNNLESNPNRSSRPTKYIFSSISHPPPPNIQSLPISQPAQSDKSLHNKQFPQTNQSLQTNESPQISPSTLNPPGTNRPSTNPSTSSPREQVTHQSPLDPWQTHRKSINPFTTSPKISTPDIPKPPGLMAPPPPLPGPPPETPPIPPPPSEEPMTHPAPKETYTQSKWTPPTKKNSVKVMKNIIDKGFEALTKNEKIGNSIVNASTSPSKTQAPARNRRNSERLRRGRLAPAISAPSRGTRAAVMERKRKGERSLGKGERFGYEELEKAERNARAINKEVRERRKAARAHLIERG